MLNNHGQANLSIGFTGLLALVFITLKLTGHIDWSWWWVLAPLWGGVALFLLILLGVAVAYVAVAVCALFWRGY